MNNISHIRSSVMLAWVAASAGCATNPATGIAASGEQLKVQYTSGTGTYTANEVTGTDVHRDENGNEIGSTDHVQAVEHSFNWTDMKYYQGGAEVDEQDYFRLAGDSAGSDQVAKIREGATLKMKIGAPLMVAGIALSALGGLAGKGTSLSTAGYIGGGTLTTVGGYAWYWGYRDMKNPHHLPAARAEQNADLIEDCQANNCKRRHGGRKQNANASVP